MAGITRIYEILQLIGLDKSETMKHKIIDWILYKKRFTYALYKNGRVYLAMTPW